MIGQVKIPSGRGLAWSRTGDEKLFSTELPIDLGDSS